MNTNKNTRAYLAWAAVCVVWGTTYLAIRVGVNDLPPMLFAGFRWIIAGPLFMLILISRKYQLPKRNEIKHIAVIGLMLLGVTNGLVVVAEQWLPSGLTALLVSTLPFWVVSIESLISGYRIINIKIASGIFLGICGVSLIFLNDLKFILEGDYLIGIVCLMAAMISWAVGSLYSQRKKLNVHPLMSASVQMIIAGLAQTVIGLSLGELQEFSFTPESLAAFLYLLFIASILGYGSYIYAISHLPVSFVTTYAYINPVIALFLGWFVLGEELSSVIAIGALIIILGVWLVRMGAIKKTG